jgi:hypothetical protein
MWEEEILFLFLTLSIGTLKSLTLDNTPTGAESGAFTK